MTSVTLLLLQKICSNSAVTTIEQGFQRFSNVVTAEFEHVFAHWTDIDTNG